MLKKRPSPSLQLLATATTSTAMSFRPSPAYRGGRNQWHGRGFYSNRPYTTVNDHLIAGNSDANRDFRPKDNSGPPPFQIRPNFNPSAPPFNPNQSFRPRGPHFNQNRQFRPQEFNQNKQFRPQGQPQQHFNQDQQFRPPGQAPPPFRQFRPQQQSRPRPQKPLDYRNWEYAKPPPPPSCERFTVLSYNILADYLAINHRSKLYYHIPRHILAWEFRKKSIMFELGLWSADILCLQEVDKFQDLEEELQVRGYSGVWKMRTGEPVDGCAIFWRSSRFKLLYEESIEFKKFGLRDNVAQICVMESVNETNSSGSALPASSGGRNKVVICNIHVLYNPKRGEIKLGQVRILLNRAYATSKLWDDAPVVLCGDFNSTPKSSLYNFISDQKLNVSELPRDKISGQDSAEIRPTRPFTPNPRAQSPDNSIRSSTSNDNKEVRQNEVLLGIQEDSKFLMSSNTTPNESASSFADIIHDNEKAAPQYELKEENEGKEDTPKEENQLNLHSEVGDMNEKPSDDHRDCLDVEPQSTVEICVTSNELQASSLRAKSERSTSGNEIIENCSTDAEVQTKSPFPSEDLENVSSRSVTVDKSPFCMQDLGLSSIANGTETITEASVSEIFEATADGSVVEDSTTFLSELLGTDRSNFVDDDESSERSLESPEVVGDFSTIDSEPLDVERPVYSTATWTPMEIEAATGSSECTTMEHPLKLRSTYSEVEDFSGTRDSNGEPQVTSYHRGFMGTVDYIWRSEGLQTVRVLAPLRKEAMQWTPGFPTKKWGSDHVALVTELAFTRDADDQNVEVL